MVEKREERIDRHKILWEEKPDWWHDRVNVGQRFLFSKITHFPETREGTEQTLTKGFPKRLLCSQLLGSNYDCDFYLQVSLDQILWQIETATSGNTAARKGGHSSHVSSSPSIRLMRRSTRRTDGRKPEFSHLRIFCQSEGFPCMTSTNLYSIFDPLSPYIHKICGSCPQI